VQSRRARIALGRRALAFFLPAAVLATALCGLVYVEVQQGLRSGAPTLPNLRRESCRPRPASREGLGRVIVRYRAASFAPMEPPPEDRERA